MTSFTVEIDALQHRVDELAILLATAYGPQGPLVAGTQATYSALKTLEAQLNGE